MEESREKGLSRVAGRRGWANTALALLIVIATVIGVLRWVGASHGKQLESESQLMVKFPVTISGAVENAGTFEARDGDTLRELVVMAGGFAEGADIEAVDLSLPIDEGTGEISIPYRADYKKPEKPPKPSEVKLPLNINLAAELELQALPGIGPVLAERIVAYRETYGPFRKTSDIMNVEGLGEKKYNELLGLISVGKEVPWDE